jgi:hypothetical protein
MLGPGFFQNEILIELHPLTRLLFAGLWTIADREGRLEDRPKRIKMALLPADDHDVDSALTDLHHAGFITRYAMNDGNYIQINKFLKYQKPHVREAASEIPAPGMTKVGASTDLGVPKANLGDGEHLPRRPVPISVSVPISVPKSVAVGAAAPLPSGVGAKRPLRDYPRLALFPWMVEDLLAMLGEHAEDFDLDAYLIRLDSSGEVLPAKVWPWLKERVEAEAETRGLFAAKRSPLTSYRPSANEAYDRWPEECRSLHNGECGNYPAHQIRLMRDQERQSA